ncbi:hypothetical protein INT45_004204 [Circinella minor]|uniref:Uncharacterized protein n=1 Tax=Circinella minor TaxID=1195481 RepID=A0A8H7VIT1_9FUNG|nr:hypothetical protein INT45_004204 [Circinella minor]
MVSSLRSHLFDLQQSHKLERSHFFHVILQVRLSVLPCLAFDIVGSIIVEYKDLPRPLSSVELIHALKKFRNFDYIVFNKGVILKKNEPFIVRFLTRRNDSVIIEFENTNPCSNNYYNNNNENNGNIDHTDIPDLNINSHTDSLDHNNNNNNNNQNNKNDNNSFGTPNLNNDNNSNNSSNTNSNYYTLYLRLPVHTSPKSISISRVLKRPIHELYVCPPSLEEEFKRRKIEAIDRGECMLGNHTIHTRIQLPPALDKLLTNDTTYHTITNGFEWDASLVQGIDHQDTVNKCIANYASKLVESVLIGDLHWVLLTQVDVFFANDFSIDDGAHKRIINPITTPKVMILERSDFGNPYYQLVIRSGQIEILAISGYYGEKGSRKKKGFMGSPIPADMAEDLLQDKEFTVNGPVNGVEYVQSVRLLRNYSKRHASLP